MRDQENAEDETLGDEEARGDPLALHLAREHSLNETAEFIAATMLPITILLPERLAGRRFNDPGSHAIMLIDITVRYC